MRKYYLFNRIVVTIICAILITNLGYSKTDSGKIPITTKSEKALEYYLQGRELSESLQGQESVQYYEKAVAEDPDFALAYLNLSFVLPSAKQFFATFDKAKVLVDKVTEGERLWISGVDAGVNGFQMKQRELYKELVATYPNDERAHNLLGIHYFGQQDWVMAIEEFNKAAAIAPDFSPCYNQLGYAQRFLGNYSDAEKAFQKYIELIPSDPNPYDSYAELLMKIGRYDDSIEQYRKALTVNPNFIASHIGIATNLNFKGNYDSAREQLMKLYDIARNDGERRAAHFAMTVSYVDEGSMDKALEEQNKQYALAEKIDDAAAMTGDLISMGTILFEMGKYDKAQKKYEKALQRMEGSNLSEEVKDNTRRFFLYNSARVAAMTNDFETAKAKADEYHAKVVAIENPFQIRLSHELFGIIALAEKNYDKTIAELQQANQQNPYNFYRMAQAYEGKGDLDKADELYLKAAHFNALNSLNYAFIRKEAQKK